MLRFRLHIVIITLLGLHSCKFCGVIAGHAVSGTTTCESRPEPSVLIGGIRKIVSSEEFEKGQMDNLGFEYYFMNHDKPILYVPDFLNETTANELKDFCITAERFTRSPIGGRDTESGTIHSSLRTSESCTLVPAPLYRTNEKYLEMIREEPLPPSIAKISREVDVSWDIAIKASRLIQVNPETVESLQLVRYTNPTAEYKLHHDHGGFYGKDTEHRTWTMLIFLNDVAAGGNTRFPIIDLEVTPRAGDAIVWRNINDDGSVDPDMVHMGKPPSIEGVEKYAVNVWFGGESLAQRRRELRQW